MNKNIEFISTTIYIGQRNLFICIFIMIMTNTRMTATCTRVTTLLLGTSTPSTHVIRIVITRQIVPNIMNKAITTHVLLMQHF